MATKDDFTEDEWNALEMGVVGAGMFVSVSEPDFTHTISETNALATYVTGHLETSVKVRPQADRLVREARHGR
jgi:hypothetical protein